MKLALSKNANKQFQKLPKSEQSKIKRKLIELEQNPQTGKKLEGELNNFRSLRVWPYRILYEINKTEERVEIHKIVHRQGVYK